MNLYKILENIDILEFVNINKEETKNIEIKNICDNTTNIKKLKDSLFVCIEGFNFDSHTIVKDFESFGVKFLVCNKKIETVTGEKVKILRAPSGDYDNKTIEIADTMNMKVIQWSVDSLDWKKLSVDEMYSRVITKTENGSILLFHNGIENTPEALGKVLEKLKNDGYEFVTVSELIYWDNYKIDHTGKQKSIV